MGTQALMRELVGTVTTHAARVLNLRDYGCAVGCRADLVVWDCDRLEEIVMALRSEEHTSELQSQSNLVCRLLLEKKKNRSVASAGYAAQSLRGVFTRQTRSS